MAKYSLHKEAAEDEFRHFRQEQDERAEQEEQRRVTYTPTPPQYNDPYTRNNVDLRRDPESYKDVNEIGRVIIQLRQDLNDPRNLEARKESIEIQLGLLSARKRVLQQINGNPRGSQLGYQHPEPPRHRSCPR